MANSRVIRIEDLAPALPAQHYDLQSRRIVDDPVAKTLKVSRVSMDPTGRADPHMHAQAEQLFIVLRGEMGVKIEGEEFRLKPGEAIFILPGEKHENFNVFPGQTDYLVISGKVDVR